MMEEKCVEKTIHISTDLEKRIEAMIEMYPGLNFSMIVKQALEEWLKGPQAFKRRETEFITEPSVGFGPILK